MIFLCHSQRKEEILSESGKTLEEILDGDCHIREFPFLFEFQGNFKEIFQGNISRKYWIVTVTLENSHFCLNFKEISKKYLKEI